jgi:hypothetical protein
MFAMRLVLLCIVGTTSIIHAGEQRKFCTYYPSVHEKNNKGDIIRSSNICWFSDVYAYKLSITPVICPPREEWYKAEELDKIDRAIFPDMDIPYTYDAIMGVPDLNRYVLNDDFNPVWQHAEFSLYQVKEEVMKEVEDQKLRTKTLQRIEKYMQILKTVITYDHPCVGRIVPERAIRIAMQWKFIELKNYY